MGYEFVLSVLTDVSEELLSHSALGTEIVRSSEMSVITPYT
jgi:hypothetical protein